MLGQHSGSPYTSHWTDPSGKTYTFAIISGYYDARSDAGYYVVRVDLGCC